MKNLPTIIGKILDGFFMGFPIAFGLLLLVSLVYALIH